ncbi:hypothetical protein MKW98_026879 [Papaver atlanticum]|uniref:glutathione transferase n=1 Tax=Papaver atlanticum TaxID=357466 RepID=A0AAD4X6V0_9MAGN|nr:hypothetical protein MKW98_026879 [Papaver atlanticum]
MGEGEESSVKLIGAWPSPYSYRVILALKLKGIKYEYINENLHHKSEMLLKYNPIHKKIPVLVHGRKTICESMIILEYIDETWSEKYPLLPEDPYEKSSARFWIKLIEEKGTSSLFNFFYKSAEEHEIAKKQLLEILETTEKHSGIGDENKKFFGGDNVNAVDLAFSSLAHWLGAVEEVLGVKVLEANNFPKFYEWTERFKQVPVIKDDLPSYNELLIFFKGIKEQLTQPRNE